MGILARKVGERFVITSDRILGEVPSKRAPQKRLAEEFQVWTGDKWSGLGTDAATFPTLDVADDYVRANFAEVMR